MSLELAHFLFSVVSSLKVVPQVRQEAFSRDIVDPIECLGRLEVFIVRELDRKTVRNSERVGFSGALTSVRRAT